MFRGPCSRPQTGFTLVEIMIVVGVIGIIVAIAIPGFLQARKESQAKACQESQLKLSGALMQYAMEQNTTSMPSLTQLIDILLYLQKTPRCPSTGDVIAIPSSHEESVVCPSDIAGHNYLQD